MTVENTKRRGLKVSAQARKITKFEDEIKRFDAILDRVLRVMPQDEKVWDRVAEVRDAVFRLQQQLRGCEVAVFAAPWIDPDDVGFPYDSPADVFWDKKRKEDNNDLK